MNNRFRTLTIAIPVLLVAVLLLTTSAAGHRQLLQYDQFPQLDEPLPVEGKQATGDDPRAEVSPQHSEPTPDESPASNSEILSIEAHHVVSPRDLSGQGSSIQIPAAPDGWTTIMSQDFEGAFPAGSWYAYDYDGSVNGEYFWDDDNYRPHNGSWSAWPANGGADSVIPPTNYPNNMNSWMSYGFIDLTDAVDAELQFSYWLQSEQDYDFFGWYVSIDGGPDHYGYRTSGNSGGWVAQNFDLTAVPVLGDVTGHNVFIIFIFTSDASISYEGVYVDDIILRKYSGDPNLAPYAPSGWDYPIVPSSVTGTHTVNDLFTFQSTYIDWTVKNLGPDDILAQFDTCLYIDDVELYCWYTNGKIAGNIAYVEDWVLNMTPTPGWHNLKIVTDVNDDVAESDETDNAWSMDFYWHPEANLAPYKPGSWSAPIVPSTLTGTNIVNDLYANMDTFIDWTVKNFGPEDVLAQFQTCLYFDSVEINCWYTNGKIAGNVAFIEDWALNLVPAPGGHSLEIVTDVYDVVLETNELDNTWGTEFYWNPSPNPDIYISPPYLTSQQTQDQQKTHKLEIHNYGSAPLEWSIFESPSGSCTEEDVPWLSVSPSSGSTAQEAISVIDVVFDSTGLGIDTHHGMLCIMSNDPDESLIAMPIELETIEELTIFLPLLMRP